MEISRLVVLGSLFALAACSKLTGADSQNQTPPSAPAAPAAAGSVAAAQPAGPLVGALVGQGGAAAWSKLSAAEVAHVKAVPFLYLHQSVGQDLEDGCEANGVKFEYFGPETTALAAGPNGGIFTDVGNVPNGEPFKKIEVVRKALKATKGAARIVSFSFGYADIRDADLPKVQVEYQKLVAEVKAKGARFLHVTPPLVFSVEENPAKQKMRAFMLATFKDDVIFDLQDLESFDAGKRCEEGGVWRICPTIRSTTACSSKSQGIDGDGAGHLCERRAKEIAKALLYAIHLAGK